MQKRRISIELEFEHPTFTAEQLKFLRSKFRKQFRYIHFMPDLSLINSGIEIATSLARINEIKEIAKQLERLGFKFSSRCGLHLHVDVSDRLTVDYLKSVFQNIFNEQQSLDSDIRDRIATLHHRFFPLSLLTYIKNKITMRNLFEIYVNDLAGYDLIYDDDSFNKALTTKTITHSYWIDLTPAFRKYFDIPMTLPSGKIVGGFGSIEFRGPIAYVPMKQANQNLWSTIESTLLQDLHIMDRILELDLIDFKTQ